MNDFMVGLVAGLASGVVGTLIVVFIYAAVVAGGRADDLSEAISKIEAMSKELERVRQAAHDQQVRADYYYDLFCTGAKANAALRNGRPQ